MVDTGADRTLLMPVDALKIGVDYHALRNKRPSLGVGGIAQFYHEPGAIAAFIDSDGNVFSYDIELVIPEPSEDLREAPSLLGRDILNQWHMDYSPKDGVLTFDP